MILAAAPATVDLQKTTQLPFRTDLLISTACFARAPWQFETFLKLRTLIPIRTAVELGENVPAQSSIMFAKIAIARLSGADFPTPTVGAVSGGSLGMIWSIGGKQLEVVFDADQTGAYILSKNEEILEDGDINLLSLANLKQALDRLMRA